MNKELTKIRSLNTREKLGYIWDYYRLWICAIMFFLWFFGSVAMMMRNAVADHWLYVTFVNTTRELGTNSDLWKEYVAYTDYDTDEALIEFNAASYFDYLDNQAKGNKYYEMLITYIEAGTLDAVVMEEEALLSLGESGWFLTLEDEKCKTLLEAYSDRLLYCSPKDESMEESQVPIGIDITDSRLMSDYAIYPEGTRYALAIGAFSENQEAIRKFLEMILQK